MTTAIVNHLWQSTLFGLAAWLMTLTLRGNGAHTRYWIWFVASVKFLIPFSAFIALGHQLTWRAANAPAVSKSVTTVVQQIVEPISIPTMAVIAPAATQSFNFFYIALAIWGLGCIALLARWLVQWLRIAATVRKAVPFAIEAPIAVKTTSALSEPGVVGIFRPVLLLPEGIAARLTHSQLQAILVHELCHVRRRDNLTAAIHMLVEAIFWFNPLVWWIGARLVEERENACDAAVLASGNDPQTYAEGILQVCRAYVESKLACVSGVSGAHLKQRIEAIMRNQATDRLHLAKKLLLATAVAFAIAAPMFVGALGLVSSAQAADPTPAAVLIKPWEPAGPGPYFTGGGCVGSDSPKTIQLPDMPVRPDLEAGHCRFSAAHLSSLINAAYGKTLSIFLPFDMAYENLPEWDQLLNHRGFNIDIVARDPSTTTAEQLEQMLRAVLAERYKLKFHIEKRQMQGFVLKTAAGGPKMSIAGPGHGLAFGNLSRQAGTINITMPMRMLAMTLTPYLRVPIQDRTGLADRYDIALKWTPGDKEFSGALGPNGPMPASFVPITMTPADSNGPTLFAALEEQLGLRLEPQQVLTDVVVIDHVEQPQLSQ